MNTHTASGPLTASMSPKEARISTGHRGNTPPPRSRPRLLAWARTLLAIVLLLPCAMAGSLVTLVPGVDEALSEGTTPTALAAYAALCGVTLVAYVLVAAILTRMVDRRPLADLGLGRPRRAVPALVAGTLVAVGLAVAVGGIASVLGLTRPLPEGTAEAWQALSGTALVVTLGSILLRAFVLQGIGEEILFRGYLLPSLSARPRLAVVIAAFAFTIPHLASTGGQASMLDRVLYLALPFGFALSAAVLGILLRSLWAAIGIHGGFHLGNVVLEFLGIGLEGPVHWLSIGAAHVLLALLASRFITAQRWAEVAVAGPYRDPR